MGVSKQTRFVKYTVIRTAAGISFGSNDYDMVDPDAVSTLGELRGFAGVDKDYASFRGVSFKIELTDRDMAVKNRDEFSFVHRGLLHLRPELLTNEFLRRYPGRIPQ